MPAPKGNSNAAITDGTVQYTPNPRVRCLPEQVDIIRDMSPAERGKAMTELSQTGVFDYHGKQVKLGDKIRESHYFGVLGIDSEHDIAIGEIKYIRGCHVIDFGKLGTYPFYTRFPNEEYGILRRRWEIISRD